MRALVPHQSRPVFIILSQFCVIVIMSFGRSPWAFFVVLIAWGPDHIGFVWPDRPEEPEDQLYFPLDGSHL